MSRLFEHHSALLGEYKHTVLCSHVYLKPPFTNGWLRQDRLCRYFKTGIEPVTPNIVLCLFQECLIPVNRFKFEPRLFPIFYSHVRMSEVIISGQCEEHFTHSGYTCFSFARTALIARSKKNVDARPATMTGAVGASSL